MRVYVSSEHPLEVLLNIITHIVKGCVPTWFAVKKTSSIAQGARHLFGKIDRSRDLADKVKKIINPAIKRNSYLAHIKNILPRMVHDDRRQIREIRWRRSLKARDSAETGPRTFVLNKNKEHSS